MNGEPAVRVLTMVPVYHLPKELEGPFESGRVRRARVRWSSRDHHDADIIAEYLRRSWSRVPGASKWAE